MFSLDRALFSPGSAEDRSSVFGWFIDTMARSDFSTACVSAVWLWAFADWPRSLSGQGALQTSHIQESDIDDKSVLRGQKLSFQQFIEGFKDRGHSRW